VAYDHRAFELIDRYWRAANCRAVVVFALTVFIIFKRKSWR
jgi:hypothetical protein